jgi:arylformamidase
MIRGTSQAMAPLVPACGPEVQVTRELQYGPDERNRLDVFRTASTASAPILVYIHGGGFVTGDKTTPGSPFYDNAGQWAARQGWIGVTMTYRLAPAHRWPSGPEDIARAVSWLREHAVEYGGDPHRIFLAGHSAGAAHVAAYIAHDRFHPGTAGIAGAILISGLLDLSSQPPSPYTTAYFGEDARVIADAATITGLVATSMPLLFTISEFDPGIFQDQAARLALAWHKQKVQSPPLVFLGGHNHISPAQSLGTTEDQVARAIMGFIASVCDPGAESSMAPPRGYHPNA